ncbi:hypothetical protein BDY24DRAFT_395581 [Mrakia frigida]|uniref:zinc finger MYND domain-containing protein n=1 Tax=Mrakia frigida TaxID=29902 RepID=UPI003FCBFE5E
MPNLFVLHTAVVSYLSSPLSTPSQRAPPLPLPLTSVPTLQPLLVRLNAVMESEEFIRPKTYFWAGQVEDNFFVFSAGLVHRDLLARFPEIVDAATTPAAIDYVACGMFRCENGFASVEQFLDPKIKGISCEERDPKKLKACARCKTVRYCSTEHQSLDWKHGKHKPFCQPILWDEDDA